MATLRNTRTGAYYCDIPDDDAQIMADLWNDNLDRREWRVDYGIEGTEREKLMHFTTDELWDYLIESGIATEQTLQVATSLSGYNTETLNSVLYILTGYRSLDQLEGEDDD